jgi:hypothetical protein
VWAGRSSRTDAERVSRRDPSQWVLSPHRLSLAGDRGRALPGIGWREKASLTRLVPFQLRVAASMRFFDMASAAAVDSRPLEAVVGSAANRYFASAVAGVFCSYSPEEVSLAFGVLGSRYPARRPSSFEGGLGSLTGELAHRLNARCGAAVEALALWALDARNGSASPALIGVADPRVG